ITGALGDLDARSVRGPILATLDPWVPEHARKLSSLTGDLVVYLPEGAAAEVSAATSGEITTDFSIEITHVADAEPSKHALARIGGASGHASPVSIETRQGQVKILRLQKVFATTLSGDG